MKIGSYLAFLFEKFPELPIKNDIRYFLSFNPLVPKFISDISPLKGYELYYHLKEGDIVVDAGAFTGDYTIFAAKKVGQTGRVIAFEPDLKNRNILEKNLRHKKITNVIIVPKGLWSKDDKLNMDASHGLSSKISEIGSNEIDVITLDNELKRRDIKKVDVIKMDIEGAEIEAVKGCINTIKRYFPFFAIASYHIVDGNPTYIFLEDYLRKRGYFVKTDFPNHRTTYAWKNQIKV